MKATNAIIITMIGLLVFSSLASAIGIVAEYWKPDNPLQLQPGQSQDVHFFIQNGGADAAITMHAQIVNGSDIASITDSNAQYVVAANGSETVTVHISVPASAKPGNDYDVGISLTSVTQSQSGQFALGSAFEKHFDVVVPAPAPSVSAESTASNGNNWAITYIVIALIVLIVIAYFVKRKKQ